MLGGNSLISFCPFRGKFDSRPTQSVTTLICALIHILIFFIENCLYSHYHGSYFAQKIFKFWAFWEFRLQKDRISISVEVRMGSSCSNIIISKFTKCSKFGINLKLRPMSNHQFIFILLKKDQKETKNLFTQFDEAFRELVDCKKSSVLSWCSSF